MIASSELKSNFIIQMFCSFEMLIFFQKCQLSSRHMLVDRCCIIHRIPDSQNQNPRPLLLKKTNPDPSFCCFLVSNPMHYPSRHARHDCHQHHHKNWAIWNFKWLVSHRHCHRHHCQVFLTVLLELSLRAERQAALGFLGFSDRLLSLSMLSTSSTSSLSSSPLWSRLSTCLDGKKSKRPWDF